jgi:hypothetical protein
MQAAGNAMLSANNRSRADSSLANSASKATRTTATNNGTQTADDDGSYDRSELQRLQNRSSSNMAGREPGSLADSAARLERMLDPKTLLPKR